MQKKMMKSTTSRVKTFPVTIGDHTLRLTREQIINDKNWTPCHGEFNGKPVRSLRVKRMGDKIFTIDDQNRLACYKISEIAVAIPKIQLLIDGKSDSTAQA